MYTIIDPASWHRSQAYQFFSSFEEPYFGVVADVDVTEAMEFTRKNRMSFFLYYLHCSIRAVNALQPFRLRIEQEEVRDYHIIHASATISRENGSYGFSFIPYDASLKGFFANAEREIERVRQTADLFPPVNGLDAVHYSSLPWIRFTSISHARSFRFADSVPKISFGKAEEQHGKWMMPCSVHVHHGLVDGRDVGQYFEFFQTLLREAV